MKISVITGKDGKIIGTGGYAKGEAGGETGAGGPIAGPGETADQIELPDALGNIQAPDEFHRALEQHMRSGKKS